MQTYLLIRTRAAVRILIVEDSNFDRLVVVSTVEKVAPKANVVTAATKEEALNAIARMRYDLVFMDVMLPDDSAGGIEATRAIIDSDPRTVIVLMTSLGEDDPRIQSLAGVDGVFHFQKPVPIEDVEMAIEAVRNIRN